MLLQTNSYIVPQDKRAEHARLLRRFRQVLARLGCDYFEVYEQVGSNWNAAEVSGRVVQIMRFRDRRHQLAVQAAERNDPVAQAVIAEFCQLINFPYQQQQGLFAVGFYNSVLPGGQALAQRAEAAGMGAAATAAAAETIEPPAAASDREAFASDLAPDEALSLDDSHAPALHAEEPVFAEGTEGIIAAAEKLTDEQLDAGGDDAVADAIAAASSNGSGQHIQQAPSAETAQEQASQPQQELGGPPVSEQTSTQSSEQGGGDEMDLAALLDPHLEPDSDRHPSKENGGSDAEWAGGLSLDAVIEDDSERGADDRSAQDVALSPALERTSEHDRNHVTR